LYVIDFLLGLSRAVLVDLIHPLGCGGRMCVCESRITKHYKNEHRTSANKITRRHYFILEKGVA
jgi:hypothetical protein